MNWRGVEYQPEENSGIPHEGIVPPKHHDKPLTIQEEMQRFLRQVIEPQAEEEGYGSFEDEDDFTEEDPDLMPFTHHEVIAMDEEELREQAQLMGYTLEPATVLEPSEASAMPQAPSGDGSEESSDPQPTD